MLPSTLLKLGLGFLVLASASVQPALAQSFPTKPVKIVVPSAPGGGTDIIARMVAQNFTKAFGQSFYVENKAGAGNLIGIEYVAKSAADGYTLLFVPSTLVLNPILYKTVNYDPIKDFSPISMVATTPNILVVNPNVKASNVHSRNDHSKIPRPILGLNQSPADGLGRLDQRPVAGHGIGA